MVSDLRVYVSPVDNTGCGHYRIIYPTRVLQDAGCDIRFTDGHVTAEGPTVFVFQRPTWDLLPVVDALHGIGVAVVVEVDDDLAAVDPRHEAWQFYHPRLGDPKHSWVNLVANCAIADLVTVSTPALLTRYAPHGRGVVVPNTLPARHIATRPVPEDGEPLRLGWPANTGTHPGDLDTITRPLRKALAGHRQWTFTPHDPRALRITGITGVPEPWQHTLDGYVAGLRRLHAAVVPLADSVFNRAKSWLKGLELAAAGVPYVAADLPEYRRLPAGLLAGDPKEWTRQLRDLLADPGLRADTAEHGLAVARQWTVEQHAWRWWEAWHVAWDNYRTSPRHLAREALAAHRLMLRVSGAPHDTGQAPPLPLSTMTEAHR